MGGKIECYLDITSYYSYIAFVQLQQTKDLLAQNGIEVEIHPFLIGAINVGSGNSPPWKVPAKAAYLKYDSERAAEAVGLGKISAPGDLMVVGNTLVPMRALTYIKSAFPPQVYITAFAYLFHAFWSLHEVPNAIPGLTSVLSSIPADFGASSSSSSLKQQQKSAEGEKLFTSEQVAQIIQGLATSETKSALKARVDEALARSAFGAPWIWATTADSARAEPFFGSDRWYAVYEFLGVPYQKMRLLPPSTVVQKSKL